MTHTLAARLERATADFRLLDHPFYRAWADGRLSRSDLAFYAGQYWRQVEAFPGCLTALADRLDGDAAAIVRANLADEVGGDHPGLWLEFAAAVGCEPGDVRSAAGRPETEACVRTFADAAAGAPPPFALGMLFGYESQTPEVSATKVAGLRSHYGIDGAGLDYFELHGELDVEHARDLAAAISSEWSTDDEALAQAEAGARAGAQAIWTLLDGVVRARSLR